MHQVLFRIPIRIGDVLPDGIPIYGFGLMLFLAFVLCTWLVSYLGAKEGIPKERFQDLAIWLFIGGILGARFTYLFREGLSPTQVATQFFRIWDGGLVFYGSIFGGAVAYVLACRFLFRKLGVSNWKLADIVAPSIALGLCLGRIGCYLNGCCYGHVACPDCPQVHFPLSAPPRMALVQDGYQTAAGFTVRDVDADHPVVSAVDPSADAADKGLRAGDAIVKADDRPITSYADLENYLGRDWPRGKNDLSLTVLRGKEEVTIPAFVPRTIGLHPTQLYSSFGAFLIFLVLMAYYPLRRRDGEVIALLALTYPLHRFLVEAIRNDETPVHVANFWPDLTFSQNVSVGIFLVGIGLLLYLRTRPVQYRPVQAVPA